jgi:hypothetical protein
MRFLIARPPKEVCFILPGWEGIKTVLLPGDRLRLKKKHPCGSELCEVLRAGMDFRLRCLGCGRIWEMPRAKLEKAVRSREEKEN